MGILNQIRSTCNRFSGPEKLRGTDEFRDRVKHWWKHEDPARVFRRATRLGLTQLATQVVEQTMQPLTTASEMISLDPLERIRGRNDLMSSLFLAQGWERAQAVGRIMTTAGFGFGTGFLISNELLMTNQHVLETEDFARRSLVQFDHVIGFDGRSLSPVSFRLRPDKFFVQSKPADGEDDLDYAIVAVESLSSDRVSLTTRGSIRLIARSGKAGLSEPMNIIQHPGGGPQQVALQNNLIVEVLPNFLRYETDTQPGSSGSPAFNGQWEIAALHHSGVPTEQPEGSGIYLLSDNTTWDTSIPLSRPEQIAKAAKIVWKSNEGVRISSIVADVRRQLANKPMMLATFEKAVTEEVTESVAPELSQRIAISTQRNQTGGSRQSAFVQDTNHSEQPEISEDGQVTWTLPLRVSVQLGNMNAAGQKTHPQNDITNQPNSDDLYSTVVTSSTPANSDNTGDEPLADNGLAQSDNNIAPQNLEETIQHVTARLANDPAVIDVRAGYVFKDGWITDQRAVVVVLDPSANEHKLFLQLKTIDTAAQPIEFTPASPEELLRNELKRHPTSGFGESLAVRQLVEEKRGVISYQEPEGVNLDEIAEPMEVICHVSPDEGWPVLKKFLGRTTSRLTVGMYDFTAPHVMDKVLEEVKPENREFNLIIQEKAAGVGSGTKKNDTPEADVVKEFADNLGDRFNQGYAVVTGPNQIFETSYHIKVAVRNGTQFWLSSGNWQSSNQPKENPAADESTDPKLLQDYNREWHVWVKNSDLASRFEKYLLHDLKQIREIEATVGRESIDVSLPDLLIPNELLKTPSDSIRTESISARYFKSKRFAKDSNKPVRVQPLLTPDRGSDGHRLFFKHALQLVRSAKKTLYFQNQTLSPTTKKENNEPEFLELIDALREKQEDPTVNVRIILRVFFASQIRPILERLKDLGLKTDSIRLQKGCHTKGIIVDSKSVLVGSHNWSNSGTLLNRDASLIFHHKGIAKYFEDVFLFDWEQLAEKNSLSFHSSPMIALEGMDTPKGYVRVPWRAFIDD